MKAKERINQQFIEKCKELGHKVLLRERLDQKIADLKREIEVLEAAVPLVETEENKDGDQS